MRRNVTGRTSSSSQLVELESDTGEDEDVSSRSTWSLTVHNNGVLNVSDVTSLPQTSHSVDTADDDVALVVPLLDYFPVRTIVVQPDSPCVVLRTRRRARPHRRRSSLDASRHGREWAATHPGSCCARALRACGDTRAPRQRVEARVRGDRDASFAGRRGCSAASLLSHTRHAADADDAGPNHHRTTPLLPVARRWVACCLARTSTSVANSQCCHAV